MTQSEAAPARVDPQWGRRIVAIIIDWGIAVAISAGFFDYQALATTAIFGVMTLLLVGTIGSTIGHRIVGLRVHRLVDGGSPPRPLQTLVRTLLMLLVIPAVVSGADGRGLHDIAAGTVIGRMARA